MLLSPELAHKDPVDTYSMIGHLMSRTRTSMREGSCVLACSERYWMKSYHLASKPRWVHELTKVRTDSSRVSPSYQIYTHSTDMFGKAMRVIARCGLHFSIVGTFAGCR